MLKTIILGICSSWVLFITGSYLSNYMWKDAFFSSLIAIALVYYLEAARNQYKENKNAL